MTRLATFFIAASCLLGNAMNANAAFIFGVESSTPLNVSAGTSGTITVFVDNTGSATSVDTYQTALNIGLTNLSLSQLNLGPVTFLPPLDGAFDTNLTGNAPQYVFGSTLLPASTSLAAGRTNLYTLPFTIAVNAPTGSISFDIVGSNASGVTDLFFAGSGSLSPTFAGTELTLNVGAVPEPATLGLGALGIALAGPAVRKWRKRKLAA